MEQTQDALAIVRALGKPTVFLTLTANPFWEEIRLSVEPGEDGYNRPDITARVFNAKLKAMMDLIGKKKLIGEVIYHVLAIAKKNSWNSLMEQKSLTGLFVCVSILFLCKIRFKFVN